MAKKLAARARKYEATNSPATEGGGGRGPNPKRARWLEEPESGAVQLNPQRHAQAHWKGGRSGYSPAQWPQLHLWVGNRQKSLN